MKIGNEYKGYTIVKDGTESFPWNVYKVDDGIKECVSYGVSVDECMKDIDNGVFMFSNTKSLTEFFEEYGDDYSWESTLEEDLIEEDWLNEDNNPNSREYNVKDIVMVNDENIGPHRILIITKKESKDGNTVYKGFLLSSKVNKANIHSRYENNIYIKNYGTILDRGNKIDKEAIIRIDDVRTFTKDNFSSSGTYKGTVTDEFFDFIRKCAYNLLHNISNKNMTWEK